MPAWLIALLPNLKSIFKTIGGWIFGYVKKVWNELWMNKWTISYAALCGTLFYLPMRMLNNWFGFPVILNILLHGIFHLTNLAWVIGNWKSVPVERDKNKDPQVSTGN
jgi:hypothetical protein